LAVLILGTSLQKTVRDQEGKFLIFGSFNIGKVTKGNKSGGKKHNHTSAQVLIR